MRAALRVHLAEPQSRSMAAWGYRPPQASPRPRRAPHGPRDDEKRNSRRRHYRAGPSGNVTAACQDVSSIEPKVEEARIVSLALGSEG